MVRHTAFMKRAALRAVAGAILNLVFGWIRGSYLSPLGFITGTLGFAAGATLATYLIEKRRLPGVLLRLFDRLPSDVPEDLMRGMLRFIGGHPALVFGVPLVLRWEHTMPALGTLPASAQAIYAATRIVGVFWLVLSMLWRVRCGIIASGNVVVAVLSIVERFIMLSVALVVVRTFGVVLAEIVASIKADPDGALALVMAVVVVYVVSRIVPANNIAAAEQVQAFGCVATAATRRARPAQDIHRTAVHEAGHLLLYGARAELPEDLAVMVLSEIGDMDHCRGRVTHADNTPATPTEGYLHWSMLMHLAGSEAEYIALGERADGSYDDNSKWLGVATAYLSCGFGEVFYTDAVGDSQLSQNRAVLNDLKAQCVRDVREFLTTNRALLGELATAIADQKTMGREQFAPFLVRVIAPAT